MNEELKEQIPKLLLKLSESGNENNEDLEEAEWRKLWRGKLWMHI